MSKTQDTDRRSRHNGETQAAKGPRKHYPQNITQPITIAALAARLLKEEKEREITAYAERRLRAEVLADMAASQKAVA